MIAIISADIVRSTSLRTKDLIALRDRLHGLFRNFEKDYPGFWARIRGNDYDHFASWIKRLADCSPVCKQIAREAAEEIAKENPNRAYRRMFESVGVMSED